MKYAHWMLYWILSGAVAAFDPMAHVLDTYFPIYTDRKTRDTLGGAIGFWMIVRKSIMYGICVKEGTLHDRFKQNK